MPHASVDGRELHYVRGGEGPPLLLVQGMSGHHGHWGEPFLARLREHFDVVAYDHRGIGLSSAIGREEAFTIADLARDATGLLDALGWERAHVLGISMGGMVAQVLALDHAARVDRLVLGCTYSGGEGSTLTAPEVFGRLAEAMGSGDRELALRTGFEVNVSEAHAAREGAYEAFREMALSAPARVPVVLLQARAAFGHDVLARLGEITAPTLVVHGTEDRMLVVGNGRLIASRIPDARLEELDGVGHLFWVERPDESAALVRGHLLGA